MGDRVIGWNEIEDRLMIRARQLEDRYIAALRAAGITRRMLIDSAEWVFSRGDPRIAPVVQETIAQARAAEGEVSWDEMICPVANNDPAKISL